MHLLDLIPASKLEEVQSLFSSMKRWHYVARLPRYATHEELLALSECLGYSPHALMCIGVAIATMGEREQALHQSPTNLYYGKAPLPDPRGGVHLPAHQRAANGKE